MYTLLTITAILNVTLGLITLLTRPTARKNILMFLTTVFIALWAISNQEFLNSPDVNMMFLWAVIAYQIAAALLFTTYQLTRSFSDRAGRNLIMYLFLAIGIITPLVPNLITTGVDYNEKSILPGQGYPIILASYLYFFVAIIGRLIKNVRESDDNAKSQNVLVSVGIVGALIAGVTTNLVLPALGIYNSVALGPSFTLIMLFFVAYAIIKYRAFETRILFGTIFYYLLLAIIPYFIFYLMIWVYSTYFGGVYSPDALIFGIPVALGFVYIFNRFNKYLKSQVNTRLINPGYDPYEVVDSLGKNLATTLDMEEVAEATLGILKRTIRADFEGLFISNESINNPAHELEFGDEDVQQRLSLADYKQALFIWEKSSRSIILYDELRYLETTPFKDLGNWIAPIKKVMERDLVRAIVPLGDKDKVLGMLLLGGKEAESPYTQQDIELLNSIASTVGLAITRSLFYQEVKDFNVTLQKKVEIATHDLQQQNRNLEIALTRLQKLRQREQDMLDIMGHELRTPITIVRNALYLLNKDIQEEKEIERQRLATYISKAYESTRREMVLIETLLAATKIDANRVQLNLEKVDLVDVVEDALEALHSTADQKHLSLNFHKPQEEVFVFADRTRIQEVQDNFVSNAIKYTMKGSIDIFIEKFTNTDNQQMIKVSVKDTGIGIPKDDIPKLGRKFFRARQYIKEGESITVRAGGTGLGLYVSFELIQIMGGEVGIDSIVGEGSTFSFTIPEYTGQANKHIDQTFDSDQPIEEELRKSLKKTNQLIDDNKIDLGDDEVAETKTGYQQLSTANDIMQKINQARKFLDSEHMDTEPPSSISLE